MDCYHLLLGRPWIFDSKTIYDGRENTYTIKKDEVSFKLIPLKENEEARGKEEKIIFGKKEFVRIEEDKEDACAATSMLEDLKGDAMLRKRVSKLVSESKTIKVKN